ncbi:Rho GTPase-activating protein RGD1 [Geosmithia morbida]|uniref:Rho GTPase-activating protein RGD1 n=1 Tax=Geosmithia morbida TaxID=1094350 RepID=A0A9P4YZD8_9HYPO|nr:Rho GTPase-activating protein RGD1 [Geosmithia morbida]KAF4124567.1 Rho GTPase-activating protein RGD1 [Geosmithia morbida]
MADLYSPAADDALPPPSSDLHEVEGDRPLTTSPPPATAADDATPDKPATSYDGGADSGSIKNPPPASTSQPGQRNPPSPELLRQVDDVLSSQIGIATLLTRLKQSIGSTREFSLFLKKRASLEEDAAQGLRKLCRTTQENMRRPDHRAGSFAQAYDELVYVHERMADNGSHFSASLQVMYDDLSELAASTERSRKTWKTNGLAAEQKVADLEQAMRKSKVKYDSLADEYERVHSGESRQTGKVLSAFKNKSAAQHEEDLLRKVQAADQTYHGHVQTLQTEKAHLESTTRPEAIKALQDLIREIDAGLTLQMQKFAAFNEKLLLSNGLSISPIKTPGSDSHPIPRSLRHAVMSIDDESDLNYFVGTHQTKVPPRTGEVKYERNPVLNPPSYLNQSQPPGSPQAGAAPQMSGVSSPAVGPTSPASRNSTVNFGSFVPPGGGASLGPSGASPPSQDSSRPLGSSPHTRSVSQGNVQQQYMSPGSSAPPYSPGDISSSQGAPQLGALSFQSGGEGAASPPPPQGAVPFHPAHGRSASSHMAGLVSSTPSNMGGGGGGAPPNPVFGVHLDVIYERDQLAVPRVIHQCIQAVDLFGLGVEGIYRQSGSLAHIQKLKHMFDTDSGSSALDFRNPENFFHDVNSVTSLLKQYLRELPDPLLTSAQHDNFVAGAKKKTEKSNDADKCVEQDDDVMRRDSLHAIINNLPDPNYATLRALCLHLHRVMENAHINRMNSHNLAVIFGPTLMGTDPSKAISDAGWQIKAVDTILQGTYQIFDED